MKLSRFVSLGMIGLAAVSIGGSQVFAAPVDTKDTDSEVTFTAPEEGALTIESAPESINFGEHTIQSGTQKYNAPAGQEVVVQDLRGTGAGWQLQVQATTFENTTDASTTLRGAKLNIPVGTVTAVGGNTATSPDSVEAVVDADTDADAVNVFQAAAGTGQGGWKLTWDVEKDGDDVSGIELEVPTALAGAFQSTVIWTLLDTPAA